MKPSDNARSGWSQDPRIRQEILTGTLDVLRTELADGDTPLWQAVRKPYQELCGKLSAAIAGSVGASIQNALADWSDCAGEGSLEDGAKEHFRLWLTEELPKRLEVWFQTANQQTSDALNQRFTADLIRSRCRPVVFPPLPMGEFQLFFARETAYDVSLSVMEQIDAFRISHSLKDRPLPPGLKKKDRSSQVRSITPALEAFLEKERAQFEERLLDYFAQEGYLEEYRRHILEGMECWIQLDAEDSPQFPGTGY